MKPPLNSPMLALRNRSAKELNKAREAPSPCETHDLSSFLSRYPKTIFLSNISLPKMQTIETILEYLLTSLASVSFAFMESIH